MATSCTTHCTLPADHDSNRPGSIPFAPARSPRRRPLSWLLAAASLALLSGCSNPPTGLVSTSQEVSIGQQAAQQFEAQTPVYEDPQVDQISARLDAVQPRQGLPWHYRVAQSNEINAFALPGGSIYIYQGLYDRIKNDPNMVAAVLGHETSHVVDRHGVKLMEQQMGVDLLIQVAAGNQQAAQQLGSVVGTLITEGYSRDDEYQADHDGVVLMTRAGFNPQGMVNLLQTLQQLAPSGGGGLTRYFDSHPGTPSRIQRVQDQIARGDVNNLSGSSG